MKKRFKVWGPTGSKMACVDADNEADAVKIACKQEHGLGIVDGDVLTVQAEEPKLRFRVNMTVTGVSMVRGAGDFQNENIELTTDKIPPHVRPGDTTGKASDEQRYPPHDR
jgi:hypothetical protein